MTPGLNFISKSNVFAVLVSLFIFFVVNFVEVFVRRYYIVKPHDLSMGNLHPELLFLFNR